MMKTATITWTRYHNYGTSLQTYALQQFLKSRNIDNVVLSDLYISPIVQGSFLRRVKRRVCRFFHKSSDDISFDDSETILLYDKFLSEYVSVDMDVHRENLKEVGSRYDLFLCGSDQIWSLAYQNSLDGYYFASFTDKTKIAYADSLGVHSIPDYHIHQFISLLSSFSFISMREKNGCELVSKLLEKEVPWVVDPVLLLSENKWTSLIEGIRNSVSDSVLAYFLSPNIWYLNYVRTYANERNLRLSIFIKADDSHANNVFEKFADEMVVAGPLEFLSHIREARIFFTDSFHGSIFSILFNTRFVTFKRFSSGSYSGQNSRIESLFSLMGISKYFVDESSCNLIASLLSETYDFKGMKDKLLPFIRSSEAFLDNALKI